MIDPRLLATHRDEIVESCARRGYQVDVDSTIAAQQQVARQQTELNEVNRLRNEHQKAGRRRLDDAEREAHSAEGRRLKEEVARLEAQLKREGDALAEMLAAIPNFVHPDSPVGGEENFRVLREVGEIPRFDFEPLDHLQLGDKLDLFDFESAAKISGQKFYFLKNEAVLLELAMQRLAIDLTMEEGFIPYSTPDLARPEILEGIGFSPRGEETQVYTIANADLCLVGTAEITLGGLHAGAILDEEELPLLLVGISHCSGCTSSPRWRCSPIPSPSNRRRCTKRSWPWRSGSSRPWRSPTG
jgi:seryl-tRNA synthetase